MFLGFIWSCQLFQQCVDQYCRKFYNQENIKPYENVMNITRNHTLNALNYQGTAYPGHFQDIVSHTYSDHLQYIKHLHHMDTLVT